MPIGIQHEHTIEHDFLLSGRAAAARVELAAGLKIDLANQFTRFKIGQLLGAVAEQVKVDIIIVLAHATGWVAEAQWRCRVAPEKAGIQMLARLAMAHPLEK